MCCVLLWTGLWKATNFPPARFNQQAEVANVPSEHFTKVAWDTD